MLLSTFFVVVWFGLFVVFCVIAPLCLGKRKNTEATEGSSDWSSEWSSHYLRLRISDDTDQHISLYFCNGAIYCPFQKDWCLLQ